MKLPASFVLVVFVILGCASTNLLNENGSLNNATLRGMVYDRDRLPVASVKVTLKKNNGFTVTASSDIHGRFSVSRVDFGDVSMTFEKEGYELFPWKFRFSEASQVVYIQMSSADQLFESAANELENKNWLQAEDFVKRGLALVPDSMVGNYLKAFLLAEKGNAEDAVQFLETFLAKGKSSFTLEQFLGDLYEKKMNQSQKALLHLRKALEYRYDPELELRINRLNGQ